MPYRNTLTCVDAQSFLRSLMEECSLPKHHCFTYEQNCERLHLISKGAPCSTFYKFPNPSLIHMLSHI